MKRCSNCGKQYEEDVRFCEVCGAEVVQSDEPKEEEKDPEVQPEAQSDAQAGAAFCVYCGGAIVPEKNYCSKCGKSSVDPEKRHCTVCGEVLGKNQKYCAKCGQKVSNVVIPRNLDHAAEKVKKVDPKKVKIGIIVVAIVLILIIAGKAILPKLFVSTEEYLAEGNYEKAYDKAGKSEKEDVLVENLIAELSAESKNSMKDPDSFKLRDAWYDADGDRIVLKIQGANSYGGDVTNYWFYTFSDEDQEYRLWTALSDLDQEETKSWDDKSDIIEKVLKNAAKKSVQEIMDEKDYKLDKEVIKRINDLSEKDMLDDVKLLDEVPSLYPMGEEETGEDASPA